MASASSSSTSPSDSIPIVNVSCLASLCRDARFYRKNASVQHATSDDAKKRFSQLEDAVTEHLFDKNNNATATATAPALKPAVAECAQNLYKALHGVGFTYISNHSVDLEKQDTIDELSREFFGQRSLEEKMAMSMTKGGKAWRGYFPVGGELTSGKPDIKEGIYFGQKIDDSDPRNGPAYPLYGPSLYPRDHAADSEKKNDAKDDKAAATTTTVWPAAIEPYMQQCEALGQAMMILLAIALELPEGPLAFIRLGVCDDPLGLFRIFHYPPPAKLADPKLRDEATLWGVGEHTDYGLLTLLKQDDVGGLQVRHRNGSWVSAPPVPGTLVVNVGDMLEAITSGLLLSTPHRVKNPDPKKMRISFPYFFDPCVNFVIRPLELSEKMAERAKASVEGRKSMGWTRWDNQLSVDVRSMINEEVGLTYGDYLTRKVSKVFPMLAKSHL